MVFGRGLTILSNLLLVPLSLSRWDKTTYAEWLVLSATVAYLSTTDLGVNTAAINEMAAAYACGDLKRYRCGSKVSVLVLRPPNGGWHGTHRCDLAGCTVHAEVGENG